jgi:hypothetical protein
MSQVLDYSAGFPGARAIKAAGYAGAARYFGFPERRKCATAGELRDFDANGIGMAAVFEDSAAEWRGGRAAGSRDGIKARNHATAIGFPKTRPIYFAIDQDVVTSGEFAVMLEYLRGAGDALGSPGLVGVYGEADVIDRARDAGVARYFWQTIAWSRSRRTAAHLFQHVGTVYVGGVACDVNDVLADDWGQHNFASTLEDDVAFTDDLTVAAPGDRNYSETHSAAQILGDTYYWASDTHQAVSNILVPAVAALGAAVSNGAFDQAAFTAHLDATIKKAIDNSIVPIVQQAMHNAGAGEFAGAVVDEIQRRLAQPPTA